MTALREEMLRVCLLEITASDFGAGNLGRDGENRNAAAMTVIEPLMR